MSSVMTRLRSRQPGSTPGASATTMSWSRVRSRKSGSSGSWSLQITVQARDTGDAVERARHEHLPDRREDRDGHLAARLLDEVRPDRLGLLDRDREILRRLGQNPARRGEREAAPGALGERDAGLALERLELLRDGRRREVQGLCDGGHGAAVGELAQQPQAANIHEVSLHPGCSFICLC